MKLKGYTGKILWIDLSKKKINIKETPEVLIKGYIGGKGFGARLLYDLLKPGTDPLSPENVLMFMSGPLVATGVPAAARAVVVTKSPHSGTFLDTYAAGDWPSWIKLAGYDGIVILGKAENLCYINITDDNVEIKDATYLRGKGVFETIDTLVKDIGDNKTRVACIGPAGENLVEISSIMCDKHHAFGRGGSGAVMGSKNLKAIAVTTDEKTIDIAKPEEFANFLSEVIKTEIMGPDHEWARTDGTPIIVDWSNEAGVLPTHNFQRGVFKFADRINAESLKKYRERKGACYRCPIACRNITKVKKGKYAGIEIDGPEYETIAMSGSNCGIKRLDAIIAWNRKVDDYGMDTISVGAVIGMAMEAYQRGIIRKEDLNGLELRFGNEDAWLKIVDYIAFRKGIGDVLAGGVKKLAEYLGGDAWKFALHIKGLEFPAYDPRGSFSMALAYGTADRGADHLRSWPIGYDAFGDLDPFEVEDKPEIVIDDQNTTSVKWSMIFCEFYSVEYETMAKLYTLVTGREITEDELARIGERIWNITRIFNVREGFRRRDDYPPYRIMREGARSGPPKGKKITKTLYDKMLSKYYKLRGWNSEGIPTKTKLRKLGLKDLIKDLPTK